MGLSFDPLENSALQEPVCFSHSGMNMRDKLHFLLKLLHPSTPSCFTYTVWTFLCSHWRFFSFLFFFFFFLGGERISSQSFLLIFFSILRKITTYQKNASFLRKLRIFKSWKHRVDVCKSTQCFKFLHSVDIFCSQVHTWYVTQNHTHVCKHLRLYTRM